MKRKSVIIAMLIVFLFQVQAMASSDREREILSDKAQHSVPAQEKNPDSHKHSGKVSLFDSNKEPEIVSDAEWEKEILAKNAKRSVWIQRKDSKKSNNSDNAVVADKENLQDSEKAQDKKSDDIKIDKNIADKENIQNSVAGQDKKPETVDNTGKTVNEKVKEQNPLTIQEKKIEVNKPAETKVEKEKTSVVKQEKQPEVKKSDDKVVTPKKKRSQKAANGIDWEREILAGKAKRSVSVN